MPFNERSLVDPRSRIILEHEKFDHGKRIRDHPHHTALYNIIDSIVGARAEPAEDFEQLRSTACGHRAGHSKWKTIYFCSWKDGGSGISLRANQ